jgi:hypothetical protein
MTDTIQNILILLLFIVVMFKPKVNIEMRKLSKEEFLDIVKKHPWSKVLAELDKWIPIKPQITLF